jgi:hypothetical protein
MNRMARWSLLVAAFGCSHAKRPTAYTPKPYLLDIEHANRGNEPGGAEAAEATGPKAATPPSAGSSATPNGSGPLAAGSPLPELVGKWCYMANVQANDGGRQSNTCFQLNADGSYQYHSETGESGQFGGSAAQSDDEGRWQARGNSLTAQSSSGKVSTYTFEKRNHPKTNDPMLIFDGQAFVTYYQKPPW